ncbi:hypothetical protein CW304_01450 [Bacillus sp. UFRGS-B20]|nr:hypothetical protein CW304_01450 [Bacillus sp. UFRGS-B20]
MHFFKKEIIEYVLIKRNIQKTITHWKTWVPIFFSTCFLCAKFGVTRGKSFLDELAPYVLTWDLP